MEETNVDLTKPKNPWTIFLILGAVICIAVGILLMIKKPTPIVAPVSAPEKYSAVFLTNGQIYFGKYDESTSILTKIYYMQAVQTEQGQVPQLVKLGNELHGPEDEMHINKDQVLFTEPLRADSQIVKAINTPAATSTPAQ